MPVFEREVEINAPVEAVWRVVSDPTTWRHWFPGIDSVSGVTTLAQGAEFNWEDDGKSGTATITGFEPNQKLAVITQLGSDRDGHVFSISPKRGFLGMGGGHSTVVHYALDTMAGGGILGNFLAAGNPKDTLAVKSTLEGLRRLVESGA